MESIIEAGGKFVEHVYKIVIIIMDFGLNFSSYISI